MPNTVILKRSNTANKLPSASELQYGELAINYAKDGEMLILKNDQDEVVGFSSDAKINAVLEIIAQSIATLQRDMVDPSVITQMSESVQQVSGDLQELVADYDEKCEVVSEALGKLDKEKISKKEANTNIKDSIGVETQRATSAEIALGNELQELISDYNEKSEVVSQALGKLDDEKADTWKVTEAVEAETERAVSAETAILAELHEKIEIVAQAIALLNDKIANMETNGISGGNYEGNNT